MKNSLKGNLLPSFLVVSALLYGAGILLSKSLMSLGGVVFSVSGAFLVFQTLFFSKKESSREYIFSVLLIVYILAAFLSHFIKGWDGVVSKEVLETTPLFLMMALVLDKSLQRRTHAVFFVGALVLATIACLFPAIPQFLTHKPISAFFRVYIFFAHAILVTLCFLTELFFLKKYRSKLERNVLLLGIFISYCLLFASQSRASFLTFHAYAFLRLGHIAFCRPKFRSLTLVALLSFLVGFSVFLFSPSSRGHRLLNLGEDRSTQTRLVLWKHNFNLFKENPLFGVGKRRNYVYHHEIVEKYNYEPQVEPGIRQYAHSLYLQELAEGGVFGFILLLGAFFLFFLIAPSSWPLLFILFFAGLSDTLLTKMEYLHPFLFFLGIWPKFFNPSLTKD